MMRLLIISAMLALLLTCSSDAQVPVTGAGNATVLPFVANFLCDDSGSGLCLSSTEGYLLDGSSGKLYAR